MCVGSTIGCAASDSPGSRQHFPERTNSSSGHKPGLDHSQAAGWGRRGSRREQPPPRLGRPLPRPGLGPRFSLPGRPSPACALHPALAGTAGDVTGGLAPIHPGTFLAQPLIFFYFGDSFSHTPNPHPPFPQKCSVSPQRVPLGGGSWREMRPGFPGTLGAGVPALGGGKLLAAEHHPASQT